MTLETLEEEMKQSLTLEDGRDEDVDTVGGLVFTLAGRVPQIGEQVLDDAGTIFEVLDADPRRIRRIRITPVS